MAYRTVTSTMWFDPRFKSLPHGPPREVWFYLLTGLQATVLPGLQRTSAALIAAETGLSPREATHALGTLERAGLIEVDAEAMLVRLPRAPKHNQPVNGKVIRAWLSLWEGLPPSPLRTAHVASLKAALPNTDWARDAWASTFARFELEPIPNRTATDSPETVPVPVPETLSPPAHGTDSTEREKSPSAPPERKPPGTRMEAARVWIVFRKFFAEAHPSDERYSRLQQLLADYPEAELIACAAGYAGSPFWRERPGACTFERIYADADSIETGLRERQGPRWRDPRPPPATSTPVPMAARSPEEIARGLEEARRIRQSLDLKGERP